MKSRLLIIFFCYTTFISYAQKYDNTWVTGYAGVGPQYGNSFLTFTDGSLIIDSIYASAPFQDNNTSFSRFDGQFFAHFNGNHIRDQSFLGMQNGTYFNEEVSINYDMSDDDLPQGAMFLPYPGHNDSVMLLYLSSEYLVDSGFVTDVVSSDISYAIIKMSDNDGKGKVVERKKSFVHDTLQFGHLQAVKHANGRDWWILIMEYSGNRFYRILFDTLGLHTPEIQSINIKITAGFGMNKFSPDGTKYVCYNGDTFLPTGSSIDIFDFDRCTGLLSNQQQFKMKGEYGGIAISPNSRYLYQALGDTVFQYDLQNQNIWSTRTIVALYDGFEDPFQVKFYQFQLAPDNKIYITATSGTQYLHVINQPDEPGLNCDFRQHGVKLLKFYYASIPNHPNYRLGPVDGSSCDSLGIDNLPKAWYRYEQDTLDPLQVSFHDLSYYEPDIWSWDFGDGTPGASVRHPDHVFDHAGVYEVCLTVSNGYGTDTHCKTLYLGVSEQENPVLQSQIQISPNPFRDFLTVSLSTTLQNPLFYLFDLTGKEVYSSSLEMGINEIKTVSLPKGIYFWQVRSGGKFSKAGKVVKMY